ncbi:MAG: lysine 2,3-aminomutase [Nitrosopumilus sp. B06]|nr:MAG: lysine 2,3-aminomutase [Nitrosopumilus sp. D6]RNJ80050.1 MAG: lysine 2,3-aminomutase [Nitrosopumilus sp. B06]
MSQESVWDASPSLKSYTLSNFRKLPQIQDLPEKTRLEMEVVGHVLPFKANNYVIEQLIDWNNIPNDPMYVLTFPQKKMLRPEHYAKMEAALADGSKEVIDSAANEIRLQLNPHPAGQMELNVPTLRDGTRLYGMQHKYKETCLFFPSQSQTCHAYCSFCFRWPQFVGMDEMKFAMQEGEQLVRYVSEHPEITDVLFTGGDPMIMKAKIFSKYVDALIESGLPNLKTIRIGTKALAYWPYKFLTDSDSQEMLDVFKRITDAGMHLAFMSHFNHTSELETDAVRAAIGEVQSTGARIRTQSPVLAHINDDADVWTQMWKKQVGLGCIPYYMFVVRDTGAQHYFGIPLVRAYEIFTKAYSSLSGLARTVRGPSMSATPGKVLVAGTLTIKGQKAILLRFLQGRNPDWVREPFLAKYDENAIWLDDLRPMYSEKFFFEDELGRIEASKMSQSPPTSELT